MAFIQFQELLMRHGMAVLVGSISAWPGVAFAQFEGKIEQRTITVSIDAMAERGLRGSALFDTGSDRLLALGADLSGDDFRVEAVTIYVKGQRYRTDLEEEDGPAWATVDLATGVMRMVQPSERMYIEMSRDDMPPMPGGAVRAAPPAVRATGARRTIRGMRAEEYEIDTEDGRTVVWVTNDNRALSSSFRAFGERLAEMDLGDEETDESLWVAEHGFPVLVQRVDGDDFVLEEVTAVSEELVADALFEPPAGYQKMTMADMMRGMRGGNALGPNRARPRRSPTNWIELAVTGPVEASHREEDVMVCSNTTDGFQARALAEWVVGVEADGQGAGQHGATFAVSAPNNMSALRDDNFRTDDRFRGPGTITIETKGKDDFGLDVVQVALAATDLVSEGGFRITVQGSFACGIM